MEHETHHEAHEAHETSAGRKRRDLFLPTSIVIAAILVAGALVYNTGSKTDVSTPKRAGEELLKPVPVTVPPVSAADHTQGAANAPLKIIEYSDLECPFCQRFHSTTQQILEIYKGKVSLVYRHFPLTEIHTKAQPLAEASECIAALGGNDSFWKFIDRVFATPSIEDFSLDSIPSVASSFGIDRTAFQSCFNQGTYRSRVTTDRAGGEAAGATGTPYSVIVSPKGNTYIIPGNLALDPNPNFVSVREIIDAALKN